MSDNTELKRLAEACIAAGEYLPGEAWEEDRSYCQAEVAFLEFVPVATPMTVLALIADLEEARNGMKHSCAIRLKKEIERLEGERDQLRAEIAGLKTGYEAYEQVNAELKAENEALRKRIDDMSPFKGAPFTGPDLKCLACGGYHYGLSGLPCPKFRNTAQSDLPETRSGQIGGPMGKGEQS